MSHYLLLTNGAKLLLTGDVNGALLLTGDPPITIEGVSSSNQGVDSTRTLQFSIVSNGAFDYEFPETEVRAS